jgi:outer membrane protein assembly factor BamD
MFVWKNMCILGYTANGISLCHTVSVTLYKYSTFFVFLLCSCTSKYTDENGKEKTAEVFYEIAAKDMHSKNFKAAAKGFDKLQERYPYSKWSVQAMLMGAYCKYQNHKYEDAIDEFTIFAKMHPYHKDTPYAYYMIGLSHYERISIVDRDQASSLRAVEAFQTILDLYPSSDYAKDAKFKIDFIRNHIAAQEMQIGRFYMKEKSYLAAINRFKNVIEKYQTTEQRQEALLRLMECYAALNMKDELNSVFAVLQLNHKSSKWYDRASTLYKKITQEKVLGADNNGPTNKKLINKEPINKESVKKEIVKKTQPLKNSKKKGKQ